MQEEQFKRTDKTMHLAEAFYTKKIVDPILPMIAKTFLTPNMITIFNIVLSYVTFFLAYEQHYVAVAILIQVYLFLDILDGNFARYSNMKSKIGEKLDRFCDTSFYSLIFIALGIKVVEWYYIVAVIFLLQIYGIIATFYIGPRLRKLATFKRTGIKKWFIERGYLIGMDLGTVDILSTIFLLFGMVKILFIVLIIGYLFDIAYRLQELKRNEKAVSMYS